MPVTVAEIETKLESRTRGLLVAVGYSTLTDGTNPDMADPITWGMGQIGILPLSGSVITVTDLADKTIDQVDRGIDHAEYRLLLNLWSSPLLVDTKVGNGSVMLSQVMKGIERRVDVLGKRLGVSMQPLVGGSIVKRLSRSPWADQLAPGYKPGGSP